jgi:hypothetical protein
VGAPTKTHLELRDIAVEEFLEMLRFDQRDRLAELPTELLQVSSRWVFFKAEAQQKASQVGGGRLQANLIAW